LADSKLNLISGDDGARRCFWCVADSNYIRYHDEEWGRPTDDDRLIFEQLCLEGFQAGLSWLTILRKRAAFRKAFSEFDYRKVAKFNEKKIASLLVNEGIVRHRGKIESAINNAKRVIELVDQAGSLSNFVWKFRPDRVRKMTGRADILAESDESKAMSKELRKRGWGFLGPTTCYAFMQSIGIVNDHFAECHVHAAADRARKAHLNSL
jgi:DNA-3-methyladenine glycosylase I